MSQNASLLVETSSALANSDSIAALVAALASIVIWLGATHAVVAGLTDFTPPTLPWTSMPSIDCLMQNAHCFP